MMSNKSLFDCYSRLYDPAAITDKIVNLRNYGYDARLLLSNALSPNKYFKPASNVAFFCAANEIFPASEYNELKSLNYNLFNSQATRHLSVQPDLPENLIKQSSKLLQNKKFENENNTVDSKNKSLQMSKSACLNKNETKVLDYDENVLQNKMSGKHVNDDKIIKSSKKSEIRSNGSNFQGHDPENMYIECHICHKRIKRLYHFHRHMRIHTGEKTHKCPYCNYKSVRKDNLKSHMKTHEKHFKSARFKQQCSSRDSCNLQENSEIKSMMLPSPRNESFKEKINGFSNHSKPYSKLIKHAGKKDDVSNKVDNFYPYRSTLKHEKHFLTTPLPRKMSFEKSYNITKSNFINNNFPAFLPSFFSFNPFYINSKPQFRNFDFKNINYFHFNPY